MPDYELRNIRADELDAYKYAVAESFHDDVRDEQMALWREFGEFDRTLAVFDGDAIVATSELISLRMAIPGGVVPMAGVSAVGVNAVHRRRGLLDRMMRAHVAAIHERGEEAIAALWASEAGIYGRWGFGLATSIAELTVHSPDATLLAVPEQRPRTGTPEELLADCKQVHEAFVPTRPGMIERQEYFWKEAIVDFEAERDGAGRLRALVFDGSGGPEGYALYALSKQRTDGRPDDVVLLQELVATTSTARAALWEHLLRLSLSRGVRWQHAAADDELMHMLTDAGAVATKLAYALFVRLVDVAQALAARAYAAPVDVVLEVHDDVCPWNASRWRLEGDATGAACERTAAPADLTLDARELGAVFLGGTALATLAAAGRIEEHTAGIVDATGQAFKGAREPFCLEEF